MTSITGPAASWTVLIPGLPASLLRSGQMSSCAGVLARLLDGSTATRRRIGRGSCESSADQRAAVMNAVAAVDWGGRSTPLRDPPREPAQSRFDSPAHITGSGARAGEQGIASSACGGITVSHVACRTAARRTRWYLRACASRRGGTSERHKQNAIDRCGPYDFAEFGSLPTHVPGSSMCSGAVRKFTPGLPITGDFGRVADRITYGNRRCCP